MKWKKIIILFFLTLVIFLFQQSFLINFWPLNLLLLVVIWLAFWQRPESWFVALLAGLLLDMHSSVLGPALISFGLVNLIIVYLSRHISLESFSHFFLVALVGILIFFISYNLLMLVFALWLANKNLGQLIRISWVQLLGIIFTYQLILIIFYLIKPKAKI